MNSSLATDHRSPTTVLWIWHAGVVAEYHKPLAQLARCEDLDMRLLVPRRWPERAGQMVQAEGPVSADYRLIKAKTLFTGLYYVYFFPGLLYHLARHRPDIVYCYEEAHTFMAALVLFLRRLFFPRTPVLLYAAQNIKKRYPFPFRLFESYCFRRADAILACGTHVARTLRAKGYKRDLQVIPLPTDTATYSPDLNARESVRHQLGLGENALLIGYAGKLVEEKGLRTLWQAFCEFEKSNANLQAHLILIGGGPLKEELIEAAHSAGLASRLHIPGVLHNTDLPAYLNALDIFVLPSESRPNWREQFGRALVEAMACGVAVIGSDSGEIPCVIGDSGLIFKEGQAADLVLKLSELIDEARRRELSLAGRTRVLQLFSLEKVAEQHRAVYDSLRQFR